MTTETNINLSSKNQLKFTDAKIRKIPLALRGKRESYRDEILMSLELRVSSNSKIFYICKWFPDKKQIYRVKIGEFGDINVLEARRLANKILTDITNGKDINATKKAIREEMTFKELFHSCLEGEFKNHLKPKTITEYSSIFKLHLTSIKDKTLSSISKNTVQLLFNRIGDTKGRYIANRTLALISLLFNHAKGKGFEKPNPTDGIKKFKEKSRERFLDKDELERLFKALDQETNDVLRDYIFLSLYTGARRENVLSMRWEDLNLETRIWFLSETKNGTSQSVTISTPAVEILKQRLSVKEISQFVFPSNSKSGHLSDPKSGWKRLLKRADIKDLRIHDLRRTLGSWQVMQGKSMAIIGKSLNHKNIQSTAVYARMNLDPVREAVESVGNLMARMGRGEGV